MEDGFNVIVMNYFDIIQTPERQSYGHLDKMQTKIIRILEITQSIFSCLQADNWLIDD